MMGRRKNLRRKLPKRHKGKHLPVKPHDSEPEKSALPNEDDQESLAWDSLDEMHLPPTPSGAEYLPSPDEMEVTQRFSCLNFSMLPCPDATMGSCEPSNGKNTRPDSMVTDMDINSLAGNFNTLPTLSDKTGYQLNRHSRKRASRRKPNKRTKKSRYALNNRDGAAVSKHHSLPQQPLYVSFVLPTSVDPQFSRSRSFRRPRRQRSQPEDDPLLCCFSDTSVMCDVDGSVGEKMDDGWELTPPRAAQCVGGVRVMESCEAVDGALNDSDLTESTSSDR